MLVSKVKAIEECWVLIGQRRGGVWMFRRQRYSAGQPMRVSFDAGWVLRREESHGDVIGFLHTHPAGAARPSRRDLRTMTAWAGAFGKPLLCAIAGRRGMRGWVFDREDWCEVERIVRFANGVTIAVE